MDGYDPSVALQNSWTALVSAQPGLGHARVYAPSTLSDSRTAPPEDRIVEPALLWIAEDSALQADGETESHQQVF